jgi:hypothetical protein
MIDKGASLAASYEKSKRAVFVFVAHDLACAV